MLQKLLLFALIFLSFWSCRNKPDRVVNRSYYYWKTTFHLPEKEREKLQELKISKLYIRYFDVDWDKQQAEARPVSPIHFQSGLPVKTEIIPTVYITNQTLMHLPEEEVSALAHKIIGKIRQLNRQAKLRSMQEIQLDCDWTENTRNRYFKLIDHTRSALQKENVKLSVTIRLHQVKHARRTGIPPADRGILMFYNMGKLKDQKAENSIYNPTDAQKYLVNFERYPLPLDVALPAFSWAVIFRKGKPVGLLNNVARTDFADTAAFEISTNNQLKVKQLQFRRPHYLYPGDVLKLEEINPELTKVAARQIEPQLHTDTLSVALYHWNENHLNLYEKADLEAIFAVFR